MYTSRSENPVVSTSTGKIAGFLDERHNQFCFFGIPYAEPPIDSLRFKPTVSKRPWQGIFNAFQFGHAGPQIFDPTEGDYEEFTGQTAPVSKVEWVGSEDNLTLNIWTRAADGKKRPVMVWIHGGANWLESSRLATYHGDSFVKHSDVVFVSINYRLGIFGFLDLGGLGGGEYAGSHCNGLRDQITALRWIKQNIEAFGGDAENITVMGESAGSIDISWLLANGHLDGIARRVVLMSGIAGLPGLSGDLTHGFTAACGREKAAEILARMKIQSMRDLLKMSTEQIMTCLVDVSKRSDMLFFMDSLFWPKVDPFFTPIDPFRGIRKHGNRDIDVMIGYTSYELGLWLTWDKTLDQHPCDWYASRLSHLSTSQRQEIVELYSALFPNEAEGVRGMYMLGDSIFVMPSIWFADELVRHNQNVWMYQYDWESDTRRRALHAGDQTFLFNKHDTVAGQHLLASPKDETDCLARQGITIAMQDSILAFICSGNPNGHQNKSLPVWPVYVKGKHEVMSFNTDCRIIQDPAYERRIWWRENIYDPAVGKNKNCSE